MSTYDVRIFRYHVDVQARSVTIEFRTVDEDGQEHPPVGYGRHTLAMNDDILEALERDLSPFLERDLAELPPAVTRTHVVTSELHALRDARLEREVATRAKLAAEESAAKAAEETRVHQRRAVELAAEVDRLQQVAQALKKRL